MTVHSSVPDHPTRLLTFSFDDGFRASTSKTAALFERFGLRTEFNVVATFHDQNPTVFGDWGTTSLHAGTRYIRTAITIPTSLRSGSGKHAT